MAENRSLVPPETIERSILLIRGQKVLLDADLAALYGTQTKVLVQAVKRHIDRGRRLKSWALAYPKWGRFANR
ncbi:MAG: ORF6N domain-containing protein [Chloroflexi bacterium]|nr:ORF6N domain-containing protein [Chloroflexota bacterium]